MFGEVENTCAPVRMLAAARIRIFKDAFAVEFCQAVGIRAEVGRHPVKDDSNPGCMQLVDHVHKIVGSAVAGCRSIIARDLISPGPVEGVLRDTHQLDMGKFHFLQILYDPVRKLSVGIEAVTAVRMLHPGADVALIDRDRLLIGVLLAALVHPPAVCPVEIGDIRCFRCRAGTELCRVRKGICFINFCSVLCCNAVLIEHSGFDPGDEQCPDPAVIQLCHGTLFLIPVVKISNHMHRERIRGPYSKEEPFLSLLNRGMRTQFFIDVIMCSISEQIGICL